MPPTLLALDTSTERMALAVLWPGGCLSQVEAGGALASSRLIPAAQQLLQRAGLTLQQLDAIAFGAGPGAFTGLRTACAVAQGLAFAIGRPVLPLDSLMLVAEDAAAQQRVEGPMWVAMDARMNEVYAAAYVPQGHRAGQRQDTGHDHADAPGWQTHTAPALYTLAALSARWQAEPPACIAGTAAAAFGARLPVGDARLITDEADRGAALARLAARAWSHGGALDAAQALPLYLRDKVAFTTAERSQNARAAVAAAATAAAA